MVDGGGLAHDLAGALVLVVVGGRSRLPASRDTRASLHIVGSGGEAIPGMRTDEIERRLPANRGGRFPADEGTALLRVNVDSPAGGAHHGRVLGLGGSISVSANISGKCSLVRIYADLRFQPRRNLTSRIFLLPILNARYPALIRNQRLLSLRPSSASKEDKLDIACTFPFAIALL